MDAISGKHLKPGVPWRFPEVELAGAIPVPTGPQAIEDRVGLVAPARFIERDVVKFAGPHEERRIGRRRKAGSMSDARFGGGDVDGAEADLQHEPESAGADGADQAGW